jgi:hypothetical protein
MKSGLSFLSVLAVSTGVFSGVSLAGTSQKSKKPKNYYLASNSQTSQSETPQSEKPTSMEDRSNMGSSESARSSTRSSVGLLYTPVSDFFLKYGASGSYHMSSKLHLGAAFLTGSYSQSLSETSGSNTARATLNGTGMAAYGTARYFVGNSFNVLSGVGYRKATLDYTISDSLGTKVDGKIDIASIVVPVFIGNSWSWDGGFSLGVDWIGAYVPLSGSSKGSIKGNLSSSTLTSLNDDLVDMGHGMSKRSSLTLLLTSLSWSF